MPKIEGELKAKCVELLRHELPKAVIMRHEDAQGGWPDLSVSWRARTSYWEFKHATPYISSTDLQELTCARLAQASFHCRYIIYWEDGPRTTMRTLIVTPREIMRRTGRMITAEQAARGFDHQFVVEHIRWVHEFGARRLGVV